MFTEIDWASPVVISLLVFIGLAILLALRLEWENQRINRELRRELSSTGLSLTSSPRTENDEDSEEEEDDGEIPLIDQIRSIESVDELIEIANEYVFDEEEENKAFLEKVMRFQTYLDEDDWDEILDSAKEGSELAHFANKKLGEFDE